MRALASGSVGTMREAWLGACDVLAEVVSLRLACYRAACREGRRFALRELCGGIAFQGCLIQRCARWHRSRGARCC